MFHYHYAQLNDRVIPRASKDFLTLLKHSHGKYTRNNSNSRSLHFTVDSNNLKMLVQVLCQFFNINKTQYNILTSCLSLPLLTLKKWDVFWRASTFKWPKDLGMGNIIYMQCTINFWDCLKEHEWRITGPRLSRMASEPYWSLPDAAEQRALGSSPKDSSFPNEKSLADLLLGKKIFLPYCQIIRLQKISHFAWGWNRCI